MKMNDVFKVIVMMWKDLLEFMKEVILVLLVHCCMLIVFCWWVSFAASLSCLFWGVIYTDLTLLLIGVVLFSSSWGVVIVKAIVAYLCKCLDKVRKSEK